LVSRDATAERFYGPAQKALRWRVAANLGFLYAFSLDANPLNPQRFPDESYYAV